MELLKTDDGGVEFYTVALTGQSGMSQSGLALLCGVSRTAIQNLEATLATSAPSETLEPFVGKVFTLATSADDAVIGGKPKSFSAKPKILLASQGEQEQSVVFHLQPFPEIDSEVFSERLPMSRLESLCTTACPHTSSHTDSIFVSSPYQIRYY